MEFVVEKMNTNPSSSFVENRARVIKDVPHWPYAFLDDTGTFVKSLENPPNAIASEMTVRDTRRVRSGGHKITLQHNRNGGAPTFHSLELFALAS